MSALNTIKLYGTFEPNSHTRHHSGLVVCADGFNLSVQAGGGSYSSPARVHPYTKAEVGYPSARPEPWAKWSKYAEAPGDPTGSVYALVPFEMIEALVALHGGEVAA